MEEYMRIQKMGCQPKKSKLFMKRGGGGGKGRNSDMKLEERLVVRSSP